MLRNLVQMSANVTRHKVVVRGCPTEVLCVGQSLQEAPENLVLLVPGMCIHQLASVFLQQ